jgi:poly(hydroxyalkanoate) depolymerase family esterase
MESIDMKNFSLAEILAATRLTRAGRLGDATAFIQRVLHGGKPASTGATPPAHAGITIDGTAEEVRTEATPRESWRPHVDRDDAERGGASFLAATFASAAGSRPYKLYVPRGYRERPLPLVVMLHGCTQSPDDFAAGTRMNDVADESDCLVAYPEQLSVANKSKCWNWFSTTDQQRDVGEPALIAGITRQIMSRYAVDPVRVHVAGLSAGGAAAAIMGATYPDLFASIGVHSGLACGAARDLPSALAAMREGARTRGSAAARPVPAIVFHGDADKVVHPLNAEDVVAQSTSGAALTKRVQKGRVPGGHAYSRTLYVDARGVDALEHWTIHGAGHAWSGGSPAGSFTDPRGPDATREMLRFFLDHPRAQV